MTLKERKRRVAAWRQAERKYTALSSGRYRGTRIAACSFCRWRCSRCLLTPYGWPCRNTLWDAWRNAIIAGSSKAYAPGRPVSAKDRKVINSPRAVRAAKKFLCLIQRALKKEERLLAEETKR